MISYIDPGTGSMLFTLIIGLATAAFFTFRSFLIKISTLFHGKNDKHFVSDNYEHNIVIFTDSKRYWNVFKSICDEFEKRSIEVEYWTMSEDDPALFAVYKHIHAVFIGSGNSAFARINTMKASICLSTTPGLDVYQWKRSKHVKYYVHITHDVCSVTAYRMFGTDFFDAVLLPNKNLVAELRELENLRNIPEKHVEIVGSTYMDSLLFQVTNNTTIKNNTVSVCTGPVKISDEKNITVLVAPSWGANCILNKYGEKLLNVLKKSNFNIIVRPHPQSFISDPGLLEDLQKKFAEDEKFCWNTDNDNFKVLSRADILISDFSGVIFDFAFIFKRPVIYADTNIDLSCYDDFWLSSQPYRFRITQKLCRKLKEEEFDNLKDIIYSLREDSTYLNGLEAIKNDAWEYRGHAAERTVDFLSQKLSELSAK